MLLHVYRNTAYRSEIALFRAHGVTAIEAEPVEVSDDVELLFMVEHVDAAPSFHANSATAMHMLRSDGAVALTQLAIV